MMRALASASAGGGEGTGGDASDDDGGEVAVCVEASEVLDLGVALGFLRRTAFGFSGVGSGSGSGSCVCGRGALSDSWGGDGIVCLIILS